MKRNGSKALADLSIVIPILNERDSLLELHRRLSHIMPTLNRAYEIIFVDDGSSDGSVQLCEELAETDSHIVLVELRRNFGKATALQAGFQVARGEIIVTLDGDLQDDAKDIPRLLEALEEGFDLVTGWKKSRQDPLGKILPSRLFNFVTSRLTKLRIRDFNCGLKAYRREVTESIDLYGELHRYIPFLAHIKGFRVGEIPIRNHPRLHGKSKYSSARFLRGALDLLTVIFLGNFNRRPLHFFGGVGLVVTLAGFGIDVYLSILWFTGEAIGHRPLLVLGTLLIMVGLQILIFGLLAETITAAAYRQSEVMKLIRGMDEKVARKVSEKTRRPMFKQLGNE